MRKRHFILIVIGAIYALAALVCTPKLRHAWWYLQENATRRYSTFLMLTAANCIFPWCFANEVETLQNLASRGVKGPWSPETFAQLPFAAGTKYVNTRMMTCARFKGILNDYAAENGGYRLWCIGRWDYLLTPRRRKSIEDADDSSVKGNVTFENILHFFGNETNFNAFAKMRIYTPADLFAAYMGDEREIAPAFADCPAHGALRGWLTASRVAFLPFPTGACAPVRASSFCLQAGADMRWVKKGGADRVVYEAFARDTLAKQHARREILKGFDLADGGKREDALATWSKAAKINPRDPLLVALAEAMDNEAKAYLDFGNAMAALRCWENKLVIFPADYSTLYNLAACLTRTGETKLAMQVLQRAKLLQDEQKDDRLQKKEKEK